MLEIFNCNNIDSAKIDLEKNKLNIKYAMNGTGKSTIARAIELHLKGDGSIKQLTPFKLRETADEKNQPRLTGLEEIKTVAIFNDEFINQFVFKQDEVLANSFEIFVKTADYEKQTSAIEAIITEIKNTFRNSKDIDQVIADLSTLIDSFGKSKSGYSEAGALAKGIGKGNKVANIPEGLESYTEYLRSPLNSKWLKWLLDGNTYSPLSDNCPYCTSPTKEKKDVISKVGKEYDAKSIEHLNKIITVLESLGKYFSDGANEKLKTLATNVKGFSKEQLTYLRQIKEQADILRTRMLNLKGMTYFSMKDAEKVSDYISDLKIDLKFLSEMDSQSTRELVEPINSALDGVLTKVGVLQGEIAKQTGLISKTIDENKADINTFLKTAGYRYSVDVEYSNETYKMRLRHADFSQPVESGGQHLSYGEKNAFSLVLFMFECLAKNQDLIILDDPISSFDRNKKYAVIDMLFRGSRSLRNKTVLLMTHDLEPIIDVLYTLSRKFSHPTPVAAFLSLDSGNILETPITREDLLTFGAICDDNIQSAKNDLVKLVYLRRYFEVQNNKGIAYELLSNLLHKRASPFKRVNVQAMAISQDEMKQGADEIKRKLPEFDYDKLLETLSDKAYLAKAYSEATNNYEKLQIFRVLREGSTADDVIQKFINEKFHIENEYIMQLNPRKYELVPSFIIDECDRIIAAGS
jgi:energy-coupling factor transporter ATP-binding protein EcfA2